MIQLSCHCGTVRLTLEQRPDYLHECNCTLCSKTGARWGYFQPSQVGVDGRTSTYLRTDKPDPAAQVHFCGACGTTTHFTLTAETIARIGQGLTGVNMRLADERELAGIELRYPDGAAWSGAGAFGYVREARVIGDPPRNGEGDHPQGGGGARAANRDLEGSE